MPGIPTQVDRLKPQTTCRERRLTPSTVRTSTGGRIGGFEGGGRAPALTIGVKTADQYRAVSQTAHQEYKRGEINLHQRYDAFPNVSLDPTSFHSGQSVVIVG